MIFNSFVSFQGGGARLVTTILISVSVVDEKFACLINFNSPDDEFKLNHPMGRLIVMFLTV